MPKLLDQRCLEILADVLEQTQDSLDGLNAERYRIDHIDDLERLDSLMRKNLLIADYAKDTLRLGPVGLYFIRNATRDALLADIERIVDYLRNQYRETPDQSHPVRLANIAEELAIDRRRVEECLDYMRHIVPYGGSVNMSDPEAFVNPTEMLFCFDRFEGVIAEYAQQWCPEAAKANRAGAAKPYADTEVHASKREQVLGAAMTAIVHWPDECKRGKTFNGTRIATLIDQKAFLWWAEGEAPLSIDSMARLINRYLKLPA